MRARASRSGRLAASLESASALERRWRLHGADAKKTGEWPFYSADNRSTKYSPLDQINKDNVAKLRVAWRRPQADPPLLDGESGHPPVEPIHRDADHGERRALRARWLRSGRGDRSRRPARRCGRRSRWCPAPDGLQGGGAHWGVAYWSQGAEARIFSTRAQYLFALDAKTGEPIADFGDGGKVDLNVGLGPLMKSFRWSGVPLVARDVIVIGSSMLEQDSARTKEGPPGDVRAYDVRTGKLRWTFHVIPHAGEPGVETWENDSYTYTGAGNVWSMMSADDELGYVYLPTSSGTNDMYGGHRLGNNLYTSSIVCLDAKTGKRVWHFQTVHHDLFDYDNPAAPILVDITVDGRRIKARGAGDQARVRVRARPRRPASRSGRSKSGRCRSRTCPARRRRRRSRSRPSRRRSSGRGCRRTTSSTSPPSCARKRSRSSSSTRPARCSRRRRCAATAPGGDEGHAAAAGIERRHGVDRRGVRSGNGHALHPVEDQSVRGGSAQGQSAGNQSGLSRRDAAAGPGTARAAARQAAVRPHHRDRPEQRRAGLDGGQRRRSARQSRRSRRSICRRSARRCARRRSRPRRCCS